MMSTSTRKGNFLLFSVWPIVAMAFSLIIGGCGSSEDSLEEWQTAQPVVSSTAMLEYRVDSLMNENRRLKDQVDAVAAENRSLTARNAEIETKLAEAAAQPRVEAVTTNTTANVAAGYEGALQMYKDKNYRGAITSFEGLLQSGVSDDLKDNCRYWIGESYYGLRDYRTAMKSFQTVLDLPRSGKKADAEFMIGNCHLALGDRAGARESFERVVSDYPVSPLVDRAKEKLARLR
jgi:TolA-binding protein